MSAAVTRLQIIETADRLFYEQGFEATAFADIATAIGISRGNFYYHFKTKDQILDSVIRHRLENTRQMLAAWQAEAGTPQERIRCFVRLLAGNSAKIMLYGCPVGTLCSELAKLDHVAMHRASEIFTLFRDWLASQFAACGRALEADTLAMHVLVRSQGVATLAAAFRDEAFLRREVDDLCAWLQAQQPAGPSPSAA